MRLENVCVGDTKKQIWKYVLLFEHDWPEAAERKTQIWAAVNN